MDAATAIDIIRLAAIPLFLYTAVTDIKRRRAPDWVWGVLVVVAVALLIVEVLLVIPPINTPRGWVYLLQATTTIGLAVGIGIAGHIFGLMGGADTKAIISTGLLYPTYPYSVLGQYGLPVSGAISITGVDMIANGFIFAAAYPVVIAVHNLRHSNIFTRMFLMVKTQVDSLPSMYGRVAPTSKHLSPTSVDLDTLRMYLSWRQATVTDIRTHSEVYRSGNTQTSDSIGDGTVESYRRLVDDSEQHEETKSISDTDSDEDPWRVDEFADHPDSRLHGTEPDDLRELLNEMASSPESTLWVSPGIPLLAPFAIGVVFTILYGSLIISIMF